MKNSTYGLIAVGTNPGSSNPALTVTHTESNDNSFSGIWCDATEVNAENCLFSDNGSYCGVFLNGGTYHFNYCTFANFWNYGNRTTPGFLLKNYYEQSPGSFVKFDINNTLFEHCIFDGNRTHEFAIDTASGVVNDFQFSYCSIRSDETTVTNGAFYNNIWFNQSPAFLDPYDGDFHLASTSPLLDGGVNAGSIPADDIDGNARSTPADIGCYER